MDKNTDYQVDVERVEKYKGESTGFYVTAITDKGATWDNTDIFFLKRDSLILWMNRHHNDLPDNISELLNTHKENIMKFKCVENTNRQDVLTLGKLYDGEYAEDYPLDEYGKRYIKINVCDDGLNGIFSNYRLEEVGE